MVTKIMTKGFELGRGKRSLLEEHILVGIRRYLDRISSVVVRIAKSRKASDQWSCSMTINVDRGPQIDVVAQADACEQSIEKSIHRAKDRLRKTIGETSHLHDSTFRQSMMMS